jgi:PKD repeat protein
MERGVRRLAICLMMLAGLSACGGGGGSTGSTNNPPGGTAINFLPPSTPVIIPSVNQSSPGFTVQFSANSTDPQNDSIAYNWDFGDGGTAVGSFVNHLFASEGSFTVKVTAVNQHSKSASATTGIDVYYLPMSRLEVYHDNPRHLFGQTFVADFQVYDPNSFEKTAKWDFGDGTTADVGDGTAGSGITLLGSTQHRYANPGHYTATLTISNGTLRTISATEEVDVETAEPIPALSDNTFEPYCSGPYCAAVDANTYSGNGVGVWRYHNSSTTPATVDISIAGVQADQVASLVFSNGQSVAAASLPDPGTAPAPALAPASTTVATDHVNFLQRNIDFARSVLAQRPLAPVVRRQREVVRARVRAAPPSLGTTAQWTDYYSTPVTYNMQVAATCVLADGRNAVFWLDSTQLASGKVTVQTATDLMNRFCGPTGIYASETSILGAPYGVAAEGYPSLIQDAPDALLDINIVIPDVPANTPWGGYFASQNLQLKSVQSLSNGALAVFISGYEVATVNDNGYWLTDTLVHEFTHLINFYQRTLVRGRAHAAFLEETSAMLTQDYLSHTLIPGYSTAESYVVAYASNHGDLDYIDWTNGAGTGIPVSYYEGMAFGAHLHRRFGLDVDRQLLNNCDDYGDPQSSYDCVDHVVRNLGGTGFEDEFARMGAATLGLMPMGAVPHGFGYPPMDLEGYSLPQVDLAFPAVNFANDPARPLTDGFIPTSHTYEREVIAAGQTRYVHNGVQVPAGTTAILVIRTGVPPDL